MKKHWLGVRWAVVMTILGGTLVGTTDAAACGGEWIPEMEVDYRPQGVARAEKDLEQGKYTAAAGAIIRMMPHVKSLKAKDSASIVARAQRVLAVATARSGGSLDVGREVPGYVQDTWLGKTAEERRANLEFAVTTLQQVGKLKQDDPAVQTELAEAMAQLDDRREEAKVILEKLAKKDLIATPEGYATLASLRKSGGDTEGQLAALKRCQAMSGSENVCSQRVDVSAQS
jgi:predicted Zn-dependent protease